MNDGLYTAASGGLLALRKLEIVANNLANTNTVGFKAQTLVSRQQEFGDTLAREIGGDARRAGITVNQTPGVVDIQTATDFTQGPIENDGNPLHVALTRENEFFRIQTPDGVMYSRAGNFTLSQNGTLVTPDGHPVLGEGGPVVLPPDGRALITNNGSITVNGQQVGRLQPVRIDEVENLERREATRFELKQGNAVPVENVDLVVGAVEMPNLQPVTSIIDMITAQRSFEAYTKTAREIDDLTDRAIRLAGVR